MAPTLLDPRECGSGKKVVMKSVNPSRTLLERLIEESGASDAETAIRQKARSLIDDYRKHFGEIELPLNMEVLASLRGITKSDLPPIHSEDAELVPDGQGTVEYRVNLDRPETRQRFSIAHEITHTFFPDYHTKSWCRTDARYRRRENPDDYVEMLCDIGASELLMPVERFTVDVLAVDSAESLLALVKSYHASREAVLRRFAEVHPRAVAAVFFSWKLKPTQRSTVGNLQQMNLFGLDPAEEARQAKKLRIDYAISSPSSRQSGHFFPPDKSVDNVGPLYSAASSGAGATGDCELRLGQTAGKYRVIAIPVRTETDDLGPNGENAVAAIIETLQTKGSIRKKPPGMDELKLC